MSTEVTWPTFVSQLKDREEVAEQTIAFRFERPADWTFKAGQFIDMTLLDPSQTDAEGNTRGFSIASGPHEKDLMVTTRMRNTAFKRVLKSLPIGTAVRIDGPFGDLTLPHNADRTLVFLAGAFVLPRFGVCSFRRRERSCHIVFSSFTQTGARRMPRSSKSFKYWNERTQTTDVSPP